MVIPEEAEHVMATGVMHDEEQRRLNRHLIDVTYAKYLKSLASKDEFVRVSFMQGMGVGTKSISWYEVPWYAWTRTLTRFWIPLIVAFALMFIGLALVADRQFAEHEHLPYPIVTFAKSLLPEEGSIISSVLKNKLFWGAAIGVALLHVNNYVQMCYPDYLVHFPTWFDFTSFRKLVPVLERGDDHGILHFNIYFTCIGFAYFIASDVALSVGLAPHCVFARRRHARGIRHIATHRGPGWPLAGQLRQGGRILRRVLHHRVCGTISLPLGLQEELRPEI